MAILGSVFFISQALFVNSKESGSFLVLLREYPPLSAHSIDEKREFITGREKSFASSDETILTSLETLPNVTEVRAYPGLLSYVVHVNGRY